MSGFPLGECVTNAVVDSQRDRHPPARTELLPRAKKGLAGPVLHVPLEA